MSVIADTLIRYPKMARGGWCYSGNTSIENRDDGLDFENDYDLKLFLEQHLSCWQHMKADAALVGFGDYKAYNINEKVTSGKPTFVRVNDEKFLQELCYEKRDPDIESQVSEFEITRFDLMEPIEERKTL